MYSLSIDYVFNRIYDVLLWIKYVWLFVILRNDPGLYLEAHKSREWDGLRDRGWFDDYLAAKEAAVPHADAHISLWQKILEKMGIRLRDSDGDGIPDVTDSRAYDADNLTGAKLKERYQEDYNLTDHIRDIFGIPAKDSDGDGVPDSYEIAHRLDPHNPDSDRDGLPDGKELAMGTDPLNNDTDRDAVLDGRDEAPLDPNVSSIGPDSDKDGVSNAIEKVLGTNSGAKDTDGDGIPDNMDTYPLDENNLSQVPLFDISKSAEHLHFSVQNPVLSLITGLISVAAIFGLIFLAYTLLQWFITYRRSFEIYEHHFDHADKSSHPLHIISHTDEMPGGISGLPVREDEPVAPPTMKEFKDHPKFAVIQGYMSSQSEALWRIGILEADNLLQEVLQEKGYKGEGVGEMLKTASFKTIDLAWDAHKIRNRIAHDGSNFKLSEHEAKKAFSLYESVFRELKAIR